MSAPLNIWPNNLLTGDIILTRDEAGFFAKAIRWFGARATGSARVNHVAVYAGIINGEGCVIEEAGKLRITPLYKYLDTPCVVYQMPVLTEAQRSAIVWQLLEPIGQGYGWGKIPLFALDGLFKTYFFTRFFGLTSFKVCSQAAAWAYDKVMGFDVFGINWKSATPDNIDDWCSNHDAWVEIHNTLPTQEENA